MSAILLHLDRYDAASREHPLMGEIRFGATPALAARALAAGLYVAVAASDLDDERLWAATQNGARSDSWSRFPPEGVDPMGPGAIVVAGEEYGYASSDVGDVVVRDGTWTMVDRLGFAEIPEVDIDVGALRVIGGGTVDDHRSPLIPKS